MGAQFVGVKGTSQTSSSSASRQERRLEIPACLERGKTTGHQGFQKAFRKNRCSGKRTHLVQNTSLPAKSRTTNLGPFGELIRATGPMAKLNPFRFSTKYQDDETDLVYYGYRYYNASTGRWLSRDPIGERGGLNLYGFVKNNPLAKVDFLGRVGLESMGTPATTPDGTYGFAGLWFNFDPSDYNTLGGNGSGTLIYKHHISWHISVCCENTSYTGDKTMWVAKPFTIAQNGTLTGGQTWTRNSGSIRNTSSGQYIDPGLGMDVLGSGALSLIGNDKGDKIQAKRNGTRGNINVIVDWKIIRNNVSGGDNEGLNGNIYTYESAALPENQSAHMANPSNEWTDSSGVIASGSLGVDMEWNQCVIPNTKSMFPWAIENIKPNGPNYGNKGGQQGSTYQWTTP